MSTMTMAHGAPPAGNTTKAKESILAKMGEKKLKVFKGYEDARYQKHDKLILEVVDEFNKNKIKGIGNGTIEQANKVPDLDPNAIKSMLITESGGWGETSMAAWEKDPGRVNVPKDWDKRKGQVGLVRSNQTNSGTLEGNLRGMVEYMSRKGFGVSARPMWERPSGFFDGWGKALERYHGRTDIMQNGKPRKEVYSDAILKRAKKTKVHVPVEIK